MNSNQHLVGVGRAVKGDKCRPVIAAISEALSSSRVLLPAAKLLADRSLASLGNTPMSLAPAVGEDRRQMTNALRGDDRNPGTILSQTPDRCGIKGVVAQPDPAAMAIDIARKTGSAPSPWCGLGSRASHMTGTPPQPCRTARGTALYHGSTW